jgi:WD40 repeat protein
MTRPGAQTRLPGGVLAAVSIWLVAGAAVAEARSAEFLHSFRAQHMVLDVAIDAERLFAGTQSGQVAVYDWREGATLEPLFETQRREGQAFAPTVRSVAVSPSGAQCAVVSSDGKLRVFNAEGPAAREPLFVHERAGLLLVRFVEERLVLLGDMRGELALLDLDRRTERYRRQLEYDPVFVLAPSPDRTRVAVGFRSSRIQIVAIESGETLQVLHGHRDSVYGLVWLDDSRLASAGKDKQLLTWNLERPTAAPRVLYAGDHYITALAVDSRAGRLALPLEEHRVGLIRVSDGEVTHRFEGHTAPVQVLAFADDGDRLISAGNDARIFVWNVARETEGSGR